MAKQWQKPLKLGRFWTNCILSFCGCSQYFSHMSYCITCWGHNKSLNHYNQTLNGFDKMPISRHHCRILEKYHPWCFENNWSLVYKILNVPLCDIVYLHSLNAIKSEYPPYETVLHLFVKLHLGSQQLDIKCLVLPLALGPNWKI